MNKKYIHCEEDIYKSFYEFYHKGSNKVDMLKHKTTADFENWDKAKYAKLAKDNPVKFLLKSEVNSFRVVDGALMGLVEDLSKVIRDEEFVVHMMDAIVFRVERYYEERNF